MPMSGIVTARCNKVPGCMNFGNPAKGGSCNSCAGGGPPNIESGESDPGRTVDAAAAIGSTEPDAPEIVEAKLAASLTAARGYADDCPEAKYPKGAFVPFRLQRKVKEDQQLFVVADGVHVGSEYAAADVGLLRGAGISRVVNISSGARTVPNFGESVDGWSVEYRHFPLEDRIGFSVAVARAAIDEVVRLLRQWVDQGHAVLVHCSAGLSRSASAVMAYLMVAKGVSLAGAVAAFTAARGRQPACTPTYWTVLGRLERGISGAGPGTAPSCNYTDWICDDVGGKGEEDRATGLQLATDAEVARLLVEHDWDADAVVAALLK